MYLKWIRKSRLSTQTLICLGGLVVASTLWQPEAAAKPDSVDKVVYDPSSGSYFEVIRNESRRRRWRSVRAAVNKRIYKGIRGRLAVIKARATHEFLKKTLSIPFDVWIGLRYHCSTGKLIWVTGDMLKRGVDFEKWHRKLYYEGGSLCGVAGNNQLMVFYTRKAGRHLSWRLSGPNHGLTGALVEYPTR